MNRAIPLFLFVCLLSVSFAEFIDSDATYGLPRMREYLQLEDEYYVTEDVKYELNLGLSIPSSESYRWLGGTGSYDDLEDGDIVCEGTFNYDLEIEAWALEDSFYGQMYDFGAGNPGTWPDCTAPGCPDGDVRVYWSESLYNSYYDSMQTSSKHLQNYAERRMSYNEQAGATWSTNERSEISTVMLGEYRVTAGGSTVAGPSDMSGSTVSRSGSFTLSSGSMTTHTIAERLDVGGALLGVYNPGVGGEYYNAFTDTYPGQPEYSRSNIHDSGNLNVYDESRVGVDAPQRTIVDLYADGEFPSPEIIEPGETIPVDIIIDIPEVGSSFYPLHFEFYDVSFSGPAGFTFTATDFDSQCEDSRMYIGQGQRNNNVASMPGLGSTAHVTGELSVPSNLSEGEYELSFRVDWRTCSGELDCNGDGRDSRTPPVTITTEVDDGGDADLICTVEPASYSSADAVQGGEIVPGEGVESWEVTITNVGEGPAVIPNSNTRSCSAVVFGATDNEGVDSPDPYPGYYAFVPNSGYPRTIEPGASRTVTVSDAPSYCSVDGGGSISATASPNAGFMPIVYPACSAHMIDEPQSNNLCEWEMDCATESCWCQVYPSYSNGHAGEEYDFVTHCHTGDCEGTASWALTSGSPYGTITSSSIDGADVLLAGSVPVGQVVTVQATMDLGCATPTVCSNTITVTEGEEHYCTVTPVHYPDASAGDEYDFTVSCDGGACLSPVFWGITEGEDAGEITFAIPSTATVGVYEDAEAGDQIRINATTTIYGDTITCSGLITIVDSPLNCTCEPPIINNGEAGGEYTYDVSCGGEACTGGSVWDWAEPAPPSGTRFVDVGSWGATIQVGDSAGPGDEVHVRARMNGGDMTCYCHLYLEEGACEISPPSADLEPSEQETFTITCNGGPCPYESDSFWTIGAGGVILDSDEESATAEFTGDATPVTLQASPDGYGTCTAIITVENRPEDDLMGCRIVPPQEYGFPGSHHEFDIWCVYGDGSEVEGCAGGSDFDWMFTEGTEWVEGGTFSAGGDGHFWADVDIITTLWGADGRVGIFAVVTGEENEEVDCDAEILLPSMDCLDLI